LDSLATTLLHIIKTFDSDNKRVLFDYINGGKIYDEWTAEKINHIAAKKRYLRIIYNSKTKLSLGPFVSLDRIWDKMTKPRRETAEGEVIDVDAPQPREAFNITVVSCHKCTNSQCSRFNMVDRRTDTQQSLNLIVSEVQRERDSIEKLFVTYLQELGITALSCRICKRGLTRQRSIDTMPLLLNVSIVVDVANPIFHIDNEFIMTGVHSDLSVCIYRIAGVIYHGGGHFTSRFVDAHHNVYYYDGMKNRRNCGLIGPLQQNQDRGNCELIGPLEQNPFPSVDDFDRTANLVFYKLFDVQQS
jgi:hypothetical protein